MNAAAPHRVTVVTVAYNSMAVLPAMLASLPPGTPAVIVDNSPAPDPALAALAGRRGARLVRPGRNLGFGAGCNAGADGAATEFLLFLNPDATLAPGAIEALVAAMDAHPRTVAANPRIADANGRPAFKRRSVLLPRRAWLAPGWPATDREVPVLSGAAFVVRRTDFQAVGGFDPAIFLYHEDDDLSLRLARDRGPLLFVRAALATHQGGGSTERSPATAAFKARAMGESRVYAAQKHGVPWPRTRAIAEALGALASPATWLSRRKRAKASAFLASVLKASRHASRL
jgi:GT2 family glycosyltransferase